MTRTAIKDRAYKGAAIELGGYAAGQILRLASNLILTRLLFPEAFGIAALVLIFVQGLAMLSDAGFEQSVVQHPRGDDPSFLNTAWSMGVIRGGALWLVACFGAWPMAIVYNEPMLTSLIPAAALALVFNGLASTSLYTARRNLDVWPLLKIDTASQVIALIVVVSWSLWHPTVWALVLSGVLASVVRMAASHLLSYGLKNKFEFDTSAARDIFHFGKWIFGSSALSFVSRQIDRLVIGGLVGAATLGIYSIATFIGEAVGTAVGRVTSGILYPVLSRVAREQPASIVDAFYAARIRTDLLGLLPLGGLTVLAPYVVQILYDDRYYSAGWMLQLLCIRVALSLIVESIQNCLFSMGQTRHGFVQNVIRTITLAVGIPLGWTFFGLEGLVWAVVISEVPVLLYVWSVFIQARMLRPLRESMSFLIYAIGLALGAVGAMVSH